MTKLVRIIGYSPTSLFKNSLEEIETLGWDNLLVEDKSPATSVFQTSIANHLRIHAFKKGLARDRISLSGTTECSDTLARKIYPATDELVKWIMEEVKCEALGRIMIVKLLPYTEIPNHIDSGLYFQTYYRFHVPMVTNEGVLFTGANNEEIHMPVGSLCQLNNRDLHGVKNTSDKSRIHIIVDIKTSDSRFSL